MEKLDHNHSLAKRIKFTPKYFKNNSEIFVDNDKKIYIKHIEATKRGNKHLKELLVLASKLGYKIYIPQAPIYLKKIIRKYDLGFNLWVSDYEKLCLDNFADIHLEWFIIK
jgi:hypothetical protein